MVVTFFVFFFGFAAGAPEGRAYLDEQECLEARTRVAAHDKVMYVSDGCYRIEVKSTPQSGKEQT